MMNTRVKNPPQGERKVVPGYSPNVIASEARHGPSAHPKRMKMG